MEQVHPAKTEVRFRDSGTVQVVVEQHIKKALGGAEEGAALPSAEAPLLIPPTVRTQRFSPTVL